MENNKDLFITTFKSLVTRDGATELLAWLETETDFFDAPCSTKFHLNYKGGLVAHSLHVWSRLEALCEKEFGAPLTDTQKESVAIIGLLHDVCKVNFYTVQYRNQKTYDADTIAKYRKSVDAWQIKHDAAGDFVWESVPSYAVNDKFPFGHGEKSVFLVSRYIKLTDEEAMAIRWHMGFSDQDFKAGGYSVASAFSLSKMAVMAHIADLEATYLDEAT